MTKLYPVVWISDNDVNYHSRYDSGFCSVKFCKLDRRVIKLCAKYMVQTFNLCKLFLKMVKDDVSVKKMNAVIMDSINNTVLLSL